MMELKLPPAKQKFVCLRSFCVSLDRSVYHPPPGLLIRFSIKFGKNLCMRPFLDKSTCFGHAFPIPGKVSDGGSGGQMQFLIMGYRERTKCGMIWRRLVRVSCRNVGSGPISCKSRCLASDGVSDQNRNIPAWEVGQGKKR